MSKHRRQRNRRFKKALERIPRHLVESLIESYNLNGFFPRWSKNGPLVVLAAKRSGRLNEDYWDYARQQSRTRP